MREHRGAHRCDALDHEVAAASSEEAERDVNLTCHKVNNTLTNNQLNRELRIRLREHGQHMRYEHVDRESLAGRDAHAGAGA